jgi:hypothetical protein
MYAKKTLGEVNLILPKKQTSLAAEKIMLRQKWLLGG